MIDVYFDGLCQPKNPGGVATYGFVVYRDDKLIHEGRGLATEPWSADATNNVAEYMGVVKALEWLVEQDLVREEILIQGDSELAIKQLNGVYKVKSPRVAPLFARARELFFQFTSLKFGWVPREDNKEADAQTNLAYAEYQARKGRS